MSSETVQLYTFRREVDGKTYAGQMPARSFEDAQDILGETCKVDGRLVEVQPVGQMCCICAGDMRIDVTDPKPVEDDDWTEEFD